LPPSLGGEALVVSLAAGLSGTGNAGSDFTMVARTNPKKWSQRVKTVSTYPPQGLFTKDAQTIARVMATKKVSPKGIGSGIRMVQFFINRAGKNLPAERRRELEKAKRILREKSRRDV
jgi:tRNA(adenine34) deaminase